MEPEILERITWALDSGYNVEIVEGVQFTVKPHAKLSNYELTFNKLSH